MDSYKIQIKETLIKTVDIEATSEQDAYILVVVEIAKIRFREEFI